MDARQLVLIIGCRTHNVLGDDGMHPEEGKNLTSDEIRVVEMNKLLNPRGARVVTLNKQPPEADNMFHIDGDVNTAR